ncbi:hypothetical protein CAL7716_052010 [Calothrix sp. PCC 7716]|nr:hypothetical protein CAL7716_052010 [Calothrix sp. PCC 7716]
MLKSEIESEIPSLINFVLINIDNVDDVSEKLVLFDNLINNVTRKLLDVISISKHSATDLR